MKWPNNHYDIKNRNELTFETGIEYNSTAPEAVAGQTRQKTTHSHADALQSSTQMSDRANKYQFLEIKGNKRTISKNADQTAGNKII